MVMSWEANPVGQSLKYLLPVEGMIYDFVKGSVTTVGQVITGSDQQAGEAMGHVAGDTLITAAEMAISYGIGKAASKVIPKIKSKFVKKPTAGVVDDVIEGGTGSKFQEVFDLADNYNLSDDTFNNHILDRHGPNSTYGNKSHFNADFDIRDGIDSTLKGENFVVGPNTAGREGYIFEQTFTNPIGTNSKGKPLYTLKVVIDEAVNVITAFPKK